MSKLTDDDIEELDLVRQVAEKIWKAEPVQDPGNSRTMVYQLHGGMSSVHDIYRVLFNSIDGALDLVNQRGLGIMLMRQFGRETTVRLYNDQRMLGYAVAEARHMKPARAIIEAVLNAYDVLETDHDHAH